MVLMILLLHPLVSLGHATLLSIRLQPRLYFMSTPSLRPRSRPPTFTTSIPLSGTFDCLLKRLPPLTTFITNAQYPPLRTNIPCYFVLHVLLVKPRPRCYISLPSHICLVSANHFISHLSMEPSLYSLSPKAFMIWLRSRRSLEGHVCSSSVDYHKAN